MPKEYFVFEGDPPATSAYEYGFYEREVAEKFAHDEAKRQPGKTFTVMSLVQSYEFK